MPDTRSHRGAHPEDATLFAPEQLPALRQAHSDLCWLLDRGYAVTSALELVGNRHSLTQRQRLALARCVCTAEAQHRRQTHQVPTTELRGATLWIDGYNLLITIEAALGGGVVLLGRDGSYRDLASQHGTYRTVAETTIALAMIGEALAGWGVAHCRWLLDRPVSNSGRLKTILLEEAAGRGWPWDVALEFSPDAVLAKTDAVVVSSDSVVLDRCARWTNAAREIVTARVPTANIVDLAGGDAPIRNGV